jgi:hypothetical protein
MLYRSEATLSWVKKGLARNGRSCGNVMATTIHLANPMAIDQ